PGGFLIAAVAREARLQLVVALDVWGEVQPRRRSQLRRATEPVLGLARTQPPGHEREHASTLTHPARASLVAPRRRCGVRLCFSGSRTPALRARAASSQVDQLCRNASADRTNSARAGPNTASWPPFGSTHSAASGIARYCSTKISSGYRGSRSPVTIIVRARIVARWGGVNVMSSALSAKPDGARHSARI